MKIAVIDHLGNYGGGSRVVRALLPAFRTLRPKMEIVYWGNSGSINREKMKKEFSLLGIDVKELKSCFLTSRNLLGITGSSEMIRRIQEMFASQMSLLPLFLSGLVHKEVESVVKGFDLVYFPWPFLMNCPRLDCPMVGTFHDFNFKYYFSGTDTFRLSQRELLNREIPVWLKHSTPIVSTHFMASELEKFYPSYTSKVKIVHLAPMSMVSPLNEKESRKIVSDLGIDGDYILYPTNMCSHKNIGPLLSAVKLLRGMGHNLSLIITGSKTEVITGHACEIGIEIGTTETNVKGLGYVTNLQMDSLIQCASAVVSSSLYEAGNGPGLDAWGRGVPVAMSNIPAFTEHIKVQDVRAEIFDPRSPRDIADKIHKILSNPEKAKADALHSREVLKKHTWLETARKYLDIFDNAISSTQ